MSETYFALRRQLDQLLMISIGAIPGAFIRWQINNDLIVNISGAALLGFVFGFRFRRRGQLILGVGFCGALTTFSSWIFTSFELLVSGSFLEAAVLIILSLALGLITAACGFFIGRHFRPLRLFQ